MLHLLSFADRWDARFFDDKPVPQQVGQQAEDQKKKTRRAVEARAKVRLARKYDRLSKERRLYPDQESLVKRLHDGSLEAEAQRLTLIPGHGKINLKDGTSIIIGGSTGGFTRAVLYDWTPPDLSTEFQ